ncbi:MAG: sigma-54 interaction domain-containing protein [Bryobacteraceae bacterium]
MGSLLSVPTTKTPPQSLSPSSGVSPRVLWISEKSDWPFPDIEGPRLRPEGSPTTGDAFRRLSTTRFDVVVVDLANVSWPPDDLVEELRRRCREAGLLIRAPDTPPEDVSRWLHLGADCVFGEQFPAGHLRSRSETPRFPGGSEEPWREFLVGSSAAMEEVHSVIRRVGPRKATVLIAGETGTGKELVAKAVHLASPRAHLPMVAVNCAAIPDNLLEAELFGHVKGAFTGAHQQRIGRFEQAANSTLFLDEIADLPLDFQTKLLRFLQEREFQRLGSSETIRVHVRVIAATNVDLERRVEEGRFREDLYYRLNVVPLRVPPLRERVADIPALVAHFLHKVCRVESLPDKRISAETLERLARLSWPGNVRQLENAVEMAVAMSGDREILYPTDFPLAGRQLPAREDDDRWHPPLPESGIDFEQIVSEFERRLLAQALERTGGNKKLAAEMLRLKRTTLSAKWRTLHAIA